MGRNGWARSKWAGVVVGVFAGGLTVFLVESLGHALLGPADPSAPETVTTAMLVSVLVAWLAGSAVGASLAVRWSGSSSLWPGMVPAVLLVGGTISNFAAFPHPLWLMIVAPPAMLAAGWMAARAARVESA